MGRFVEKVVRCLIQVGPVLAAASHKPGPVLDPLLRDENLFCVQM